MGHLEGELNEHWHRGRIPGDPDYERCIDAKKDYETELRLLEKIPEKELHKNNIKHLIRTTEGLTRLGIDHSEKVKQYKQLAEEKGYGFSGELK